MCQATGRPPTFTCTIGDLTPGQQFHDPNGETWMVLSIDCAFLGHEDSTMVVNLGNARLAEGGGYNKFGNNGDEFRGKVTPMYRSVRLGYDHRQRLYASTNLNDWYDRVLPLPVGYDAQGEADTRLTVRPDLDAEARVKAIMDLLP